MNVTSLPTEGTTPWAPLALARVRGHLGNVQSGTVVHGGHTYTVRVVASEDGRSRLIKIANGTGSLVKEGSNAAANGAKTFATAGSLVGHGQHWTLRVANADSQITERGYSDTGRMADMVERIVHSFLGSRYYAICEAAKTPEQKAQEAEQERLAIQGRQQERIATEAQDLLDLLDNLVPSSTAHYAVEDARKALKTLAAKADTIQTKGTWS